MTIRLLYHDPKLPGGVSPFDEAILSIARDGELKLACPYISLDYLLRITNGTSWRLLTDIEEWLDKQATTGRNKIVEFLREHHAVVKNYPRLHAKVVIGSQSAMFGSANFTKSGILARAEVSAIVDDIAQVQELTDWFEACWERGQEVLPRLDAIAEYVNSLPEKSAADKSEAPKIFPPLLAKPATLVELEGQQAATGEVAAQPQAQETEQSIEDEEDEVVFSHVRPKSAIDVADTKRSQGNLRKRRYLFCLIRIARKATLDIEFLHALAAKLAVLTPKRFGPDAGLGDYDRERGIRKAVRLARTVSDDEDSQQALRDAANDAELINKSNEPQYSEEFYPQIRMELGIK